MKGPKGSLQAEGESVILLVLSTLKELVATGTTVKVWEYGTLYHGNLF
jgi:hypothetical protein